MLFQHSYSFSVLRAGDHFFNHVDSMETDLSEEFHPDIEIVIRIEGITFDQACRLSEYCRVYNRCDVTREELMKLLKFDRTKYLSEN